MSRSAGTGRNTPAAPTRGPAQTRVRSEADLDSLLTKIEVRNQTGSDNSVMLKTDPLERFREQILCELTPVIMELSEKYASRGVTIQMDASNFLQGGRNVQFEFAIAGHRNVLKGTVTSEAIAFEEIRYSPSSDGDITSGPSLRLRQLDATTFRDFICKRVVLLLKQAVKGI
jgi:hypothetical protein